MIYYQTAFIKSADKEITVSYDFSDILDPTEEIEFIASSSVPIGLEFADPIEGLRNTVHLVVSQGNPGMSYSIKCFISTSLGRVFTKHRVVSVIPTEGD